VPAPLFWYNKPSAPGWQAQVLKPVGALYATATKTRLRRGQPYRATVPVICIGNINVGGTGKTPTAIAMTERLLAAGHTPHLVSRGYGGSLPGPIRVDPNHHRSDEVGDEPLLLAAFSPTWVAKDRAAGVRAAEKAGADVILLDDGFQNPSVFKDISVVVVDAYRGFGNGQVIPAGPLREPVPIGLQRADAVLSIGPSDAQSAFKQDWSFETPHLVGQVHPLLTGMPWKDLPVLAFAGIGHPEKFFKTLEAVGAKIVKKHALEDHEPLTDALMQRLEHDAKTHTAQLVTTEKDAARLPDVFRSKVLTLPVRLVIEDWGPLDAKLNALGIKTPT